MDRLTFGRSYGKLHREIDKPYVFLGRKHRQLFHDVFSTVEIAKRIYPDGPIAQEAAALHVHLDILCSENPEFHRQLKRLADEDARNRRRASNIGAKKRKGGPLQIELKKLEKSCKQLREIRKLSELIRS